MMDREKQWIGLAAVTVVWGVKRMTQGRPFPEFATVEIWTAVCQQMKKSHSCLRPANCCRPFYQRFVKIATQSVNVPSLVLLLSCSRHANLLLFPTPQTAPLETPVAAFQLAQESLVTTSPDRGNDVNK
ncbi:hypothetical protein J6590_003063 [Homalodisca vitripennis]|nr:hypothetical protein J6590_003063 [Homalodisca vitripennis]